MHPKEFLKKDSLLPRRILSFLLLKWLCGRNNLPQDLEKESARGRKDVTNEIEKENKYQVELLKKDFTNTIDRQNDKIAALESEVKNYKDIAQMLQEKLDKSYAEIKDMATKTVEASGNVKILNNSQDKYTRSSLDETYKKVI